MASYHKRKTKKGEVWDVRFRLVEDEKLKNKKLSGFKRKSDAEKAYRDYINNPIPSSVQPAAKTGLLFSELYLNFIEYKEARVKESTMLAISAIFQTYILPYFKDFYAEDITKHDVLKFQNSLLQTSLSHGYKMKVRQNLSSIFNYAEMYHDLKSNPVKLVEPFKDLSLPAEMNVWNKEQALQFLNCIENLKLKCYFATLYLTGCRKNEATPLTWDDVDLVNNKISFKKSYSRKTNTGAYLITSPKNKYSIRTIAIPTTLSELLQELKESNQTHYVFGNEDPPSESPIQRAFERYTKRAELPKIRIHDLRHSHASYLISQGVTIVAIAKRLGHKDIEQTLNTYAHFFKEDEQPIITTLEIPLN